MPDLIKFKAKICYTASGILIHDNKVLLVKHKKLGIWLPPGGHIEPNELAHQAAEREFWEETGLKVKAVDNSLKPSGESQFLPTPISANLHWISKENYNSRNHLSAQADNPNDYQKQKGWEKGCEQHYNLQFLVEPISSLDYHQNQEETDGIAWFSQDEIDGLETVEQMRVEIKNAFEIVKGKNA